MKKLINIGSKTVAYFAETESELMENYPDKFDISYV